MLPTMSDTWDYESWDTWELSNIVGSNSNILGQRGTMLHGDTVPCPKDQSCIVWTESKDEYDQLLSQMFKVRSYGALWRVFPQYKTVLADNRRSFMYENTKTHIIMKAIYNSESFNCLTQYLSNSFFRRFSGHSLRSKGSFCLQTHSRGAYRKFSDDPFLLRSSNNNIY